MKVVKYPKWEKQCTCKRCGTVFIITSKDVAKGEVSVSHWPHHHALPYCPFCSEQNDVSVNEFYNNTND